jgi:hypothetical protein
VGGVDDVDKRALVRGGGWQEGKGKRGGKEEASGRDMHTGGREIKDEALRTDITCMAVDDSPCWCRCSTAAAD